MESEPLWTPAARAVCEGGEAPSTMRGRVLDGPSLITRQLDAYASVIKCSDLIALNALAKSDDGLSPLPSLYSEETSHDNYGTGNDDSLHGVSSPAGSVHAMDPATPPTLLCSSCDRHTSPTPAPTSVQTDDLTSGLSCEPDPSCELGRQLSEHSSDAAPQTVALCNPSCVDLFPSGCAFTQGTRRTMEDRHRIEVRDEYSFFAVYDGHGGPQCAAYLECNLHTFFFDHVQKGKDPETALLDGILEADQTFVFSQSQTWGTEPAGSCCAVVVLTPTHVIVGNVGDSEVVRCRDGEAQVLSVRHTPRANEAEKSRVEQAGGRVVGARVRHPARGAPVTSIALSRSIGDAGFKLPVYTEGKVSGVIGDPYVHTFERNANDEFIVIGCDGLWDAVPHATVVKQCRELIARYPQDATAIADALVNSALEEGSSDNITVIVILLHAPSTQTPS